MSQNLEKTYDPKAIESKLYDKWCENQYFHAEETEAKSRSPRLCRRRILQESFIWGMRLIILCRTF